MEHKRHLTKAEQAAQTLILEHQTELYFVKDALSSPPIDVVTADVHGGPPVCEEVLQRLVAREGDSSARSVDQLLAERHHLLSLL